MPVTVGANSLSVVHKGSGGTTIAFPDMCKTPVGPAIVPLPYPNVAMSLHTAKGAKSVKADGNPICTKASNFYMSTGDEAGVLMGIASNKIKGKAEFVNASFDVQVEGKGVARAFDPMFHNNKNTPPFPLLQPPIAAMGGAEEEAVCLVCEKNM